MTQVFRLFISSTFSDFSREREVLQENVFPFIDEYCQLKGYQFQPIDLRWGISEEAQLDQKTLEVCLNEVKVCKHFPHPNFLIMAGNRYGWVPLPYLIESEEFRALSDVVDGEDKQLLQAWYCLDENQLPVSYILKERVAPYDDVNAWFKVEQKLRRILQVASNKVTFGQSEKEKYFLSATEQEVNEGIFHYLEHTDNQLEILKENPAVLEQEKRYVFAFMRDIQTRKSVTAGLFIDADSFAIEKFKKSIRETLDAGNIFELKTEIISEDSLKQTYLVTFEEDMKNFLKHSIDEQIEESSLFTQLEEEQQRQALYLKNKLHLFTGREKDLAVIAKHLAEDSDQALIVYGKSGLGKSSLMAKSISNAAKNSNVRIAYRFVGVSPESSSTKFLWSSILEELGYDIESDESETFDQFSLKVYELLIGISKPTIIFIDAVDQFTNSDAYTWLPEKLPKTLKIVISALNDKNYEKASSAFETLSKMTSQLYPLTSFEVDETFIQGMLKPYHRGLQDAQLSYVLSQYAKVQSPLYLKIAEQELVHWKGEDYTNPEYPHKEGKLQLLSDTQQGVIAEFIQNLSDVYHHNKRFVSQVMGYIYASVDGLSEKELISLLSLDAGLIQQVAPQTYHKNKSNSLPVVVWARLKFQISSFLSLKRIDGIELMQFFHREFNDAIRQVFDVKSIHQQFIHDIYNKIILDNMTFHQSRYGKLYTSTVLNYVFTYEEQESLHHHVSKLIGAKNNAWLQGFISALTTTILDYYKGGQVLEAQRIYLSILEEKHLFNLLEKQDEFLYLAGKVEQSLANIKEAKELFKQALSYAEKDSFKLAIQVEIAKTNRKGGDVDAAKEILEDIIAKHLQKDSILRADALIQLGLCFYSLKKPKQAHEYYKMADEYLLTTDNRELRLYNWLGISTAIADLGMVQEGLELLEDIKMEAHQYGYRNFYTDSLNGIAKKYLFFGNYSKAIEYASEAFKLGELQGNKILAFLTQSYIVEGLAGLYKSTDECKERRNIEEDALARIAFIEDYKKRKVVKETVILDLVNHALEQWEDAYSL